MTQIDETIASYLTALKIEGKTPKTIESYANSLADFRRVGRRLGLPDTVDEYGVEQVYQFLGALQERGASPGYQHRRHREVQTLFSWCVRMGIVEQNVFKRVPRIKVGEKIKPPFSPDEVRLLLQSQDRESLRGCRNYAIILFLLDTGVRASECISIRLEDVEWERRRVFVRHAKGQKQRWVGIGEVAASALRDYVERFRGEREGMLFLSGHGEALTTGNSLRIILRRMGDAVGLAKVHPHRFRHTFATWAIQSGAREIDVQMLLGHSDLTMTQRYARTYTSEQAVQAHGELSPVAQLETPRGSAAGDRPRRDAISVRQRGTVAERLAARDGHPSPEGDDDLRPSPTGVSHVIAPTAGGTPPPGKDESMATTKEQMRAGQTLVAKYKKQQHSCEVVEHDGRMYFVLPKGQVFKSPSAAGKAVTGTATNGYLFWSIADKPPAGQTARQQAARAAAERAA